MTLKPLATRCPAIGHPILPRPRIPTVSMDFISSVRLDSRFADHPAPLLEILLYLFCELLGRAGVRHQALACELFAHVGLGDDRADVRVVPRENVRRQPR